MSERHNRELDQGAIVWLLDASTRHLDRQEFDKWLDLFAEDATYVIISSDGVTELGTFIVDADKAGIAARIRLLEDPTRVREQAALSHLVTWGPLDFVSATEAHVESRFALFETRNIDGVSRLAYVGRYEDTVVKGESGKWQIASRKVVLDTFSFKSLLVPL